jgi:hypothetical protein
VEDIQVRVTHGNTVTIAEIDLGIGIMIIGEAKLHPNDKVFDPVIGASYAVGRAMTAAGKYLTDTAAGLVDGNGCQCPPCQIMKHWSDCAVHGTVIGKHGAAEISYEGPCDCGGTYSVESDEVSTGQIPHNEVEPSFEDELKLAYEADAARRNLEPLPAGLSSLPPVGNRDVKPGWFSMLLKKLRS